MSMPGGSPYLADAKNLLREVQAKLDKRTSPPRLDHQLALLQALAAVAAAEEAAMTRAYLHAVHSGRPLPRPSTGRRLRAVPAPTTTPNGA